jgi:hypothetical protein
MVRTFQKMTPSNIFVHDNCVQHLLFCSFDVFYVNSLFLSSDELCRGLILEETDMDLDGAKHLR